ncbi:MAG: hypothetical protein Q4B42_05070, partial [Oscillospiraceae bacterium]|nr:hypothetical protein [Oscillospiraceae bacterium]
MKKRVFLLLAVLLIIACLSACWNAAPSEASETDAEIVEDGAAETEKLRVIYPFYGDLRISTHNSIVIMQNRTRYRGYGEVSEKYILLDLENRTASFTSI